MNVTVAHFMLLERPLWGNQGAGFGFTAYPTNVVRRLWTTDDASFSPDFPFNSPPSEMKITLTGLWRSWSPAGARVKSRGKRRRNNGWRDGWRDASAHLRQMRDSNSRYAAATAASQIHLPPPALPLLPQELL